MQKNTKYDINDNILTNKKNHRYLCKQKSNTGINYYEITFFHLPPIKTKSVSRKHLRKSLSWHTLLKFYFQLKRNFDLSTKYITSRFEREVSSIFIE